jgi:integrase
MNEKIPNVSIYKPSSRSRKSDPWLIAYSIGEERPVIRASAHRRVTEDLAWKISETLDRIRLGLAAPDDLRFLHQMPRPLQDHIDEYYDHLLAKGKTPKHARQMLDYVTHALTPFEHVGQVTASAVQQRIADIKETGATKNRHVAAVMMFLRWGAGSGERRWPKLQADLPLARYAHSPGKRRVLSLSEIADLIDAASTGPLVERIHGSERSLIYRTVLASGLRANELRQLQAGDIRQQGIMLSGAVTKNRKECFLFLPPSLMKEIHQHVLGKMPNDRAFNVPFNTARMLKADMTSAGIHHKTREGVFDFHALRHQCGSMLASAGVPIKAVQVHMRHASIRMTMDTYGHLYDTDRARTVGAVDRTLQRLAQRDFQTVNEVYGMATPELKQNQWSDGESNPDLLNAIQKQPALIQLRNGRLRSKRGREIAPGAAQRLLARVFSRAVRGRR